MATYRVYEATYPFQAREDSELTIDEGDRVVVYEKDDGSGWPDPTKWMKGKNQSTGKTGDFPGTYCSFVEEVVPAPPPPVAERVRLPMLADGYDAPPVPPRRGEREKEEEEGGYTPGGWAGEEGIGCIYYCGTRWVTK